MPIFLPFIEQNIISVMEQRYVIVMEVFVDETIINDELLGQRAVRSIFVELESLDVLLLAVGVLLKSLDDRHASLVGLEDVHDGVSDEIRLLFARDVAFHGNNILFYKREENWHKLMMYDVLT
jgi:hypothetical protein